MSNVKLSPAELALACNADILLTKNNVIGKVYALFGQLCDNYANTLGEFELPNTAFLTSPKISRGENYLGLPWVMLDYPRFFSKEEIFSIRTMFWWGRHFSQFLFLKGSLLTQTISERIIALPAKNDWYICTNKDPWQHHFNSDNMHSLKDLSTTLIADTIKECGFLKLGTKIPIEKWESVENIMVETFKNFILISS